MNVRSFGWSSLAVVALLACGQPGPEPSISDVGALAPLEIADDGFVVRNGVARVVSPIGIGAAVAPDGLELSVPGRDAPGVTTATLVRMQTVRIDGVAVEGASLRVSGSRATLARTGFDEWFVNGARGIEHGYTLHAPRDSDEIRIDVAFEGLQAVVRSGELVSLVDDRGRARLSYRGPHAEDARGRALPIAFEQTSSGLELVLDADGASYPVTIDPTFELADTLFASMAGMNHYFGEAVAVDGTRAAIGAPFEGVGVVYAFELEGGVWSEQDRLDLAAANSGQFGAAVAIDGDTIVAGAPSLSGGGFVRIYRREMSGWTPEDDLTPPVATDDFGASVSVEGDTLAVGAPGDDTEGSNAGAVFLYKRDVGNQWLHEATLYPDDGGTSHNFGREVVLAGDQLLVGQPGFDIVPADNEGQIAVFERSAGVWSTAAVAKLQAPAAIQRDGANFGRTMAVDGDRLVATNRVPTFASFPDKPSEIVVLQRNGGTWSVDDVIDPPGIAKAEDFGASIALAGDRLVAGAPGYGSMNEGRAYVFELVGGTWQQAQALDNPTPQGNDFFGWDVASSATGNVLVADNRDSQAAFEAGAVYVFPLVGDPCTDGSTCATGICDEMVCCNVPCGPCGVCDVSGMEGQCQALVDGTEVPACSPVLCDGASFDCPACMGDDDCVSGHYCDGGACLPLKANGEVCAATNQCQSMHCVDGVCCDTGCEAQCQACDEAGSVGTCTTITGQPHGDRPPCPADFCEADIAYSGSSCRGGLTCEADSTACTPYGCDEITCHDSCLSTQQCAEGFTCLVDRGDCVSTEAQCEGSTLTFPDATTQSCEPYRCTDAGVCLTQCTSGEQCSEGYVCDSSGACVTAPPAVAVPSCAMGGDRSDDRSRWGWLLALGALTLRSRRRAA